MSKSNSIPAAEGLFTETADGPRLVGSRCATCGSAYFPRAQACHNPECERTDMRDANFGPRGRLASLTIQGYPPPAPVVRSDPYTPYAVGLVDLEDEALRVIGRLRVDDPENIELGGEVELVLASLGHDDEGRDVISWQFQLV
ncbi:MAG: OB-fold domain-containing protein [Deltaproteobacteria bacterium]|nr:OB-fold domain-containing protein [Deltaproteobacteria bacterium]